LVFANNRLATEILLTYLRDACGRPCRTTASADTARGYLPRERREIEHRLRDGAIRV
jgi:DEAD/DEAH box helicase domain-containing protein